MQVPSQRPNRRRGCRNTELSEPVHVGHAVTTAWQRGRCRRRRGRPRARLWSRSEEHLANAAPPHPPLYFSEMKPACPQLTRPQRPPPATRTFSRKLLFLAAPARRALAALHARGGPSSWSSAQALSVCGRGWSWPSRFPCSFLTVLARGPHCSSSKSVTGRDRRDARVPSDCGRAGQLQADHQPWRSKSQDASLCSPRPRPNRSHRGLLESPGRRSS